MKKNKGHTRQDVTNTRKAARKQKRLQKKVHRQEHYMKKKTLEDVPKYVAGRFVKRPASPEADSNVQNKKKKPQLGPQDILKKERQKEIKETKKLQSQMDGQRKKMLVQANEEEDKVIKKLEKQLGLNKCKNKKNFFSDDGLDYLLEICDRATSEQIVAAEKHLADVEGESDFEEDLAAVTGKEHKKKKINKDKKKDDGESEDDISNDESGDMSADESEELNNDGSEDLDESDDEMDANEDEGSFGDEDDNEMSGIDEQETDDEPDEKSLQNKKNKSTKKLEPKQDVKEKPIKERVIKDGDLSNVFSDDEVSHLSGDDDDDEQDVKEKPIKERVIKEDDLSNVFSDDEVSHLSGEDDDDDDDMEDFIDDSKKEIKKKPDVWEDIYGRKRDKDGNIIKEEKGTYIPPHLRNKDSGSEKDLTQLKRQVKSILNKLAGTNLHWACSSIEALYSSNSRHSVSSSLVQLWLSATVSTAHAPDRLVAEHAALVAVLHANVATEIGAHFLQELTKTFDEMMQIPQSMEDKSLDNIVSCLAHLYTFKIYHASLLYDIFARLLEELTEKNIECVLVALRTVGGVLRKDEPLALKEFIHDTQATVARLNQTAADGSRIKFLLEVLMAVKNNNLTKIPNYDPSYGEQLRKQIRTVIRKGNYITPLNIRLEDLLKADERGKWWIVGSAWEGNRPLPVENKPTPLTTTDQKLLELARKQRMNTDVRRSIFCVIMGAEDYMDAYEKLQHLGLRGPQQREVVHVVLACCLQERNYNPYYHALALQLCSDRKYQLSFQYSSWDKIKELESLPKHSVSNLAQFLVQIILNKGLPLSVLKVIQFSDLNKHSVKFMRQILLALILNSDLQATLESFHRIAKPPKLHMFRESLRLFIQHFLLKNAGKSTVLSDKEMAALKERAVEVDKILTMHESKLRL